MVKLKKAAKVSVKVTTSDHSTEEKIKMAARKMFTQKGFAATRTRDIAEEAGINLALLNYYFRSKEKLFDLIMLENMQQFAMGMKGVLNNETSTLQEKFEQFVGNYIDMLTLHPDLPLFILHEIKANPDKFVERVGIQKVIFDTHFYKQLTAAIGKKGQPFQIIMNMMSLTVFPFVASPLLRNLGNLSPDDFSNLIASRKRLIPLWINAMLTIK